MAIIRLILLLAASGDLARPVHVRAEAAADMVFFDQKIRPILEQRCFECHSHQAGKMKNGLTLDSREGWFKGGDSGPALMPGDPDNSLLIRAVRYTDRDLHMPPKERLSEDEIASLVEWVRRGAPDPRVQAAPVAAPTAPQEWWSLRRLSRPAVPGTGHPIDAFIEAKLAAAAIQPAPLADRRTLIRRLTLDLHGLLPSPEEVTSFLQDPDPQAYVKLVDRLLASPAYGERWARHWLDTIHFADTHGFEHDLMRTNAWPYRDYVIESLNRETPWSRFVREQLAADVFFPDEPALTVALGFIAAGPWDQSTAQTAPRNFEYLDRDDIVTQTMATLASSTVNCARCHDHKFDPITQEDYYALQAVFAGIGRGDVAYDSDPRLDRERRRWKRLLAAVENQEPEVLLAPENESEVRAWEALRAQEARWEVLRPVTYTTSSAAELRLLEDSSLLAEGPRPETDTYSITANSSLSQITAVRLEVLSDPALPKNGPGRQDNGNFHLSEFSVQVFTPGGARGVKASVRAATSDFDQSGWTIRHSIDGNDKTAWGVDPQEGHSHRAVFELGQALAVTPQAPLVFQLKQVHGQGHVIGKCRLSVTADHPQRAAIPPAGVTEALRVPATARSETQRLAMATFVLRRVAEDRLAALPRPSLVFAAGADFSAVAEGGFYRPWRRPKEVHVLKRGDVDKPGAAAAPGALSAVSALPSRFEAASERGEAARRQALAQWLTDAENPLTWRSIVNRVWHHHFGRGLSDTLNDFGRMGSIPSHPELLDWLAVEFRDSGGSLKRLHRLIVTSAAYQRSGRFDPAAAAKDPENAWLWRRQSRRLDAESYRDSVLAMAGRLDSTMGGPGVQQFKLGKPIQLTPTVDYTPFSWDSPGAGRRSIYRFVYRGLPDPFMDALDFPDAGQLAPTRSFSASALQALVLLNNDFVLHHSQRWAERLQRQCPSCEDQVRAAFQLAYQREPTSAERADAAACAARDGLPALCRILLNSNEYLFVD
ncbi:MAG: PSD1 and planctomycete cytochrome C domain-containing protein [Verrucomicrobiota bacterium]